MPLEETQDLGSQALFTAESAEKAEKIRETPPSLRARR